MKKLWKIIVFEYNSIHNSISYWFAKHKANRLHKMTGKRYHVVPRDERNLMVVDNSYIDIYNRAVKKQGGKPIDIISLLRMSYYSTSVQSLQRK